MDYPNLLINLALLFLWCRIWTDDENTFFFNPLISGPMRVVDRILGFVHNALPVLPNRALAAVTLLAALALKTLLSTTYVSWSVYAALLKNQMVTFLIFTFQIAALNALLTLMSPHSGRAGQLAKLFSRPVEWLRPAVLQLPAALLGIVVCSLGTLALSTTTYSLFDIFKTQPTFVFIPLLSIINILEIWYQCTFLAIIVSLLGLLMPRSPAVAFARDWCALLLGRFSGWLMMGGMDLTPLLFFYVIRWLHIELLVMASRLIV